MRKLSHQNLLTKFQELKANIYAQIEENYGQRPLSIKCKLFTSDDRVAGVTCYHRLFTAPSYSWIAVSVSKHSQIL